MEHGALRFFLKLSIAGVCWNGASSGFVWGICTEALCMEDLSEHPIFVLGLFWVYDCGVLLSTGQCASRKDNHTCFMIVKINGIVIIGSILAV